MQKRTVLDDDRIGWLLLRLSTPAFFSMSVTMLYNIVNTIFISRYSGPLGIAGLSIAFPLQMLSMGVGQMTGMGGASHISRLIGAKNLPQAEKVLGNALSLSIVVSLAISLIGLVNVDFWLRLMGASETILPYAREYVVVILAGNVFSILASTVSILLIAEGNVRVSMVGMIAGAVINIILCSIFIIPLGWGIRGSALATVIAQAFTVAYYAFYYFKAKTVLNVIPQNLVIKWEIARKILSIGVSALVRTMAGSVSAVIVNRLLMFYGGDIEISTFGLMNRIMMFVMMPGQVIGQGLQPILGYNYGARHFDRVFKSIRLGIISASICSVAAFICMYVFTRPVVAIFTSDPELTRLTVEAARIIFLAQSVLGFMTVGATVFQALGKAIPAFITSLARPALFLMPFLFLLSHFFQVKGVWMSFSVTDALSALLTLVFMIPLMRELRKMREVKG